MQQDVCFVPLESKSSKRVHPVHKEETINNVLIEFGPCKVHVPEHKRKKSKRGSKFDTLSVETIEYKLSEEEKVCATCGSPLTEMKKEIRKELVIIPAEVKVIELITYVYSCRNCDKEGTGI